MVITLSLEDDPLVSDEGSVVLLQGRNEEGHLVRFGCDWRPAQSILFGLEADGEVSVEVEGWQIVGGLGE